ncbi:MAG TPA: 4-alpha-glucanotransferase [Acidimicrobiia bacterium]|nr:4-alpha-glucanotransferase [Acidimicrobiia bacterium]
MKRPRDVARVLDERSSGVLLHITSLPRGRLGDDAYRFVDWLHAAGQRYWQVLPVGPPDRFGSPYSSSSAFSAWPGLLARPDARVTADAVEAFVASHAYWAADWAAFAGPGALADQVRFDREWRALRAHATERGVRILGDVPFYVAAGGADVHAHRELFRTGVVAGVPPDDWSADGQLWGNPMYDWARLRATGYRWWIERLRRALELFDAARVDHFRGFVAAWAVPAGSRTARTGSWRRADGRAMFAAAVDALGPLPLVAENLGIITPPVERLRRDLGFPGMVVLQFAFGDGLVNPQRLGGDEQAVVYTGTHDNPTTVEWWRSATEHERRRVDRALAAAGIDEAEPNWKLTRLALASRARLAVVPLQDLLGLGREARLNRPGRRHGNWTWRVAPGALSASLAARVRAQTEAAGRI